MEIYLLFLITAFVIGVFKPELRTRNAALIILGMAILVSAGYFVLRLV